MRLADRLLYRMFLKPVSVPWKWPKGPEPPEAWTACRWEGLQGELLAGLWGEAEGTPRGTVVCAHPIRPEGKGFFLRNGVARFLRRAGYHVLLFDFNGFAESPRASLYYPLDVLSAGQHATRMAPGLPLGLFGTCFGASAGLCVLSRPDNPFRAVIAEGTPIDWLSYYTARRGAYGGLREQWYRQWLPRTLLRIGSRLRPDWADQFHPLKHLQSANGLTGVLFIYGEQDSLLPPSIGRQYMEACAEAWTPDTAPECSLWVVPGAKHLKNLAADPRGFRDRVVGFFDKTLARTPEPEMAT